MIQSLLHMSKTAASSGGAGDIVYSIPVLRKLGVKTLYVKETEYLPGLTLFASVAPLIESQDITCLPTSPGFRLGKFDPAIHIDYNLDNLRNQPLRGKNHIIKSYFQEFGLSTTGWNDTFLKGSPTVLDYTLFHVTSRWRERSNINWKEILKSVPGEKLFIGFEEEWDSFRKQYGRIDYQETKDLLSMASYIKYCKALYCNQSVALTLAQGLGKEYWLERKPGKSNTLFYTKNEHIL